MTVDCFHSRQEGVIYNQQCLKITDTSVVVIQNVVLQLFDQPQLKTYTHTYSHVCTCAHMHTQKIAKACLSGHRCDKQKCPLITGDMTGKRQNVAPLVQ